MIAGGFAREAATSSRRKPDIRHLTAVFATALAAAACGWGLATEPDTPAVAAEAHEPEV